MSSTHCFHCHEVIPKGIEIHTLIQGQQQPMCCHGCKAVAEFISQEGYCEFYDYRGDSQPANKAKVADEKWQQFDQKINLETFTKTTDDKDLLYVSIRLEGMYCSACGWLIDKHLRQLQGITDIKLNSITKIIQVTFNHKEIKLSQILSAINHLGYLPQLNRNLNIHNSEINERRNALKRLVVAGFCMMFIMTLSIPLYSAESGKISVQMYRFFSLLSLLVATLVYFYSGKVFLNNAFRDLLNKHLGMDVPIAISLTLAYSVSCYNVLSNNSQTIYFDSMVMFVFFLLAGRYIEMTVRHQGMSANDALASMIPMSVICINDNSQDTIPLTEVNKGDVLLTQAGETIAIDGVIIKGSAKINEALITGEEKSKTRSLGDKVMAGSILESGEIYIKSQAIGEQTILASLAQMLESAQLQKPKTLQIVDKVASWFVSIVLLLSVATAIYYAIHDVSKIMPTVLAVLVASCPCALSLATPAALTSASVKLMKHGMLVNNLDAIIQVHRIKHWFFDKTGTLTKPNMSILRLHNSSEYSDNQLLKICATLEHHSSHPLASAFDDYYDESIKVTKHKEIINQGIVAEINSNLWQIGNQQLCQAPEYFVSNHEKTVVFLCKNNKAIAAIELENPLRDNCLEIIQELKQRDYQLSILSGDKQQTVATIAKQLNIENFVAEMKPEEKINRIISLQQRHVKTLMLGDGINDAPVLAQSDVSISFNQGTQLARAASDLIIMGSSLKSLKILLTISQKTHSIIKQNIIWALIYNLCVTPLAMMGYLTPWMAAIGMSISSLFVILNAKRILF